MSAAAAVTAARLPGTREHAAEPAAARQDLRLAVFSPVPPTPTGIAAYLVDLLPLLPQCWRIDIFTDAGVDADVALLARGRERTVGCYAHTEFAARQAQDPYDLNVYQVGNSSERTWLLDYVAAHPGLLVLHDGVLHPARVDAATAQSDLHGYRDLARRCRPDVGNALGHLVAGGLGGPALYFNFPMCEDVVRASLVTGMHGELACEWLRSVAPEARVVGLGHWRSVHLDAARRDVWRQRLADGDEVLIGSFGNIGAERRLDRVLHALADGCADTPWRLVVAGRVDARLGLDELAAQLGVADRVAWHPHLDDADFVAVMGAVDVAVNLRWPQVRASSGVLHQLMQLGVPVLLSDVVHWREYPDDAVARIPPGPDAAEAAALRAALRHWIEDGDARRRAGTAAAAWAALHITPDVMRRSYVEAVAEALRERSGQRPEDHRV